MADRLRDLVLRLTADSRQLTSELRKIESGNSRTTRKIESEWRQLSSGISSAFGKLKRLPVIGGLAAGAIGGVSVAGLKSLADDAQEAADQVDKLAGKLGISTTALQEYQFAAGLAGVTQEQLDVGLRTLGRNLGLAALGTGEAKTALEALGIAVRDSSGQVRSIESVFEDVIRALGEVEDAAVATALAQRILGESGAGFVNLAGDLDGLIARAQELGIAIDEEVIASFVATKDATAELDAVLDARLAPAMSVVSQVAVTLKKEFVELVEEMTKGTEQAGLFASALRFIAPELIQDVGTLDRRIDETSKKLAAANAEWREFLQSSTGTVPAFTQLGSETFRKEIRKLEVELEGLQRQREKLTREDKPNGAGLQIAEDALVARRAPSSPRVERATRAKVARAPVDEEAARRARELADAQSRLNSIIQASLTPAERLTASLDQMAEDYRSGLISLEQFGAGQEAIAKEFAQLEDQAGDATQKISDEFGQLEQVGIGVFEGLTGAMADFLLTGQLNLQSFVQSFARELLQLGIKGAIFGATGGAEGPLAGLLGFRASGGPVLPGRPYVVGEKGPELLVPKQAGYVLPNVSRGAPAGAAPFAMSGGAPVYVTVNNSSRAGVDVNQRTGPSGQREIEILVTDVIARDVGRGGPVGRAIDKRLGVRPRGV